MPYKWTYPTKHNCNTYIIDMLNLFFYVFDFIQQVFLNTFPLNFYQELDIVRNVKLETQDSW